MNKNYYKDYFRTVLFLVTFIMSIIFVDKDSSVLAADITNYIDNNVLEDTKDDEDTDDVDISLTRAYDLSYCYIEPISPRKYTGNEITPKVTIYNCKGERLYENVDFSVKYHDNVNVTDYHVNYKPYIEINAKGRYHGSVEFRFDIVPINIHSVNVAINGINNVNYTGKKRVFKTSVSIASKTLHEDNDYDISYVNNTNAGIGTAKLTFTGNYVGSLEKKFYIYPKAPVIKNCEIKNENTAVVNWNKDDKVTGYVVYKYNDVSAKYELYKRVAGSSSSIKITGLKKDGNSNIKIKSYIVCSDGKTVYSKGTIYTIKTGKTVTKIKTKYITENKLTLAKGQSRNLNIEVFPTDAYNKSVSYKGDNKAIVSVDSNGRVTALSPGKAKVYVTSNDSAKTKLCIEVTVTKRAKSFTYNDSLLSIVSTNHQKYTYNEMVNDINILKSKYKEFLSVNTLGMTYDNRKVFEIILGNAKADKHIVVVASTHAREYMNSALVMKQIEFYCKYYYTGVYNNKYFSEILENTCIHFVPMLNPDGVTISQSGTTNIRDAALRNKLNEMYRKYGRRLGRDVYFSRWKANARGVDLNSNYYIPGHSYKFGSGHTASEGYYGLTPQSERETKYLVGLVNAVKPSASLSYHSTGSQIYWQYGQTGRQYRNSKILLNITKMLNGYQPIVKISKGPGFSDWMSCVKKTVAMTIETGVGICPLDKSEFTSVWNKNRYVSLANAKAVFDNKM